MHLSNWSLINYTYPHDTINYHNWTYEDYVKATRPSALVTKSFMMMGLVGVPHSEQLTQSMWVQKVANEITTEPKMAGHVSTISATEDLPMGDKFVKYLDELQDKVPITVGCRCAFPDVPPPGMVDGLKELDRRNLTFDIFVVNVFDTEGSHAQLAKAIEIAQQVPELTMVLDHMGVAGIAGAKLPDFTRWSRDIELLAKLPNTYIKISGPAIGIEEIRPFVHQSIRTFGYERSIYSTNWYVIDSEEYFFSYRAWASAMVLFLEELNATEEDAHWVLHKAAEKAYRLPPL
jgi:predicted TIM-barrel fold metal-dependent hydrolase